MTLRDKITAKARGRLEAQAGEGEQILHSATVGSVGLVLTTNRVMIAHPMQGVYEDVSLPLSAIQNVAWKKAMLGSQGLLTIHTSGQTLSYKATTKQGEPAAVRIRQAIAAR